MADPFVAEIRIFPFNFAPKGWAFCDGQILPLSQNTALFSLLGTYYGGDGKSNFALPNMQGNAPMHQGQGTGLSLHDLGEIGGSETVELLDAELPSHTHGVKAVSTAGTTTSPDGASWAVPHAARGQALYASAAGATGTMAGAFVNSAGEQAHNNMQPYLTLNFCIALQGVYPPRT